MNLCREFQPQLLKVHETIWSVVMCENCGMVGSYNTGLGALLDLAAKHQQFLIPGEGLVIRAEDEHGMTFIYNNFSEANDIRDIPDYGELMTWEGFVVDVQQGSLIDYDGHGNPSDGVKISKQVIIPSMVKDYEIENPPSHIVWYNR